MGVASTSPASQDWVPPLGDEQHGFPYLSGAETLVIKDAIMLGAGIVTIADSANLYLKRRAEPASGLPTAG